MKARLRHMSGTDRLARGNTEPNKKIVLVNFSRQLQLSLGKELGEPLSATRFANEFNLRAYGTQTITRQTALNWLKGRVFPDPGRLFALASWLDMDLNEIFKNEEVK
jgi:transcriptional regulator with XRE-family HTH domain